LLLLANNVLRETFYEPLYCTVASCFSSNPHFQTALLSSYTLCTIGVVANFEPLPNYY